MNPETNTQIATTDKLTIVQRTARLLAASRYFTDVTEMAQAAVKIMAGEELGIPPVASMMGINIIKNKVSLSANLIASRVRAHGYEYRIKQIDATGCRIDFFSKIDISGKRELLGESAFTDADAKTAEIKSEMYKKYPRNMFFARAMSNGARWYTPDVFAGVPTYTAEELGATVDEHGDVEHAEAMEPIQSQPEITDLRLPRPSVTATPEAVPTPAPASFADRLLAYTKQKFRVGEFAYYNVLARHGYEHANEVVKLPVEKRKIIYDELLALPDESDTAQEPEL